MSDPAVQLSPPDERDYPVGEWLNNKTEEIPEDFAVWQPAVIESQYRSDCVARVVSLIMECLIYQETGQHKECSVGWIYATKLNTVKGVGMYPREGMMCLVKEGEVLRDEWECWDENPLCREKRAEVFESLKQYAKYVKAVVRISTKEELQRYMMQYGLPVLITAPMSAFMFGSGLHAVACYGWLSEETYDKEYGYRDYHDLRYTNSWGDYNPRGIIKFEEIKEMWGVIPFEGDEKMRGTEHLHPELQEICKEFLKRCKDAGLKVKITDTLRTKEEQDTLYAQGRTAPGSIVTNVKYPDSAHNWGVAFDICQNIKGREYDDSEGFFAACGKIGRELGLTWGGDWTYFKDKPHFELKKFMPNSSTRWLRKTYDTPERFKKEWEENDMITAEQLAALLPEAFAILAQNEADEWAKPALKWAKEQGLMVGDESGNQMPQKPVARQEMAQILFNMRNKSEV